MDVSVVSGAVGSDSSTYSQLPEQLALTLYATLEHRRTCPNISPAPRSHIYTPCLTTISALKEDRYKISHAPVHPSFRFHTAVLSPQKTLSWTSLVIKFIKKLSHMTNAHFNTTLAYTHVVESSRQPPHTQWPIYCYIMDWRGRRRLFWQSSTHRWLASTSTGEP